MSKFDKYKESSALNYSSLSKLAVGPRFYKESLSEEKDFSDGLLFGSALDILIFEGEQCFQEQFYVMTKSRPSSEMQAKFCEKLAETDNIQEAYNYSGYKVSLSKITASYDKQYVKALKEAENRLIIGFDEYTRVLKAKEFLEESDFTKQYFNQEEGEELLFQEPIYFRVEREGLSVEFKCLLDIIRIDHNNKLIYPADLKTTGDFVYSFPYNFIKWHYYLQASMYNDATFYCDKLRPYISDGYTIENFRFIVVESRVVNKPVIFKCTRGDLAAGKHGGILTRQGDREIKGYLQLAEELIWHQQTDLWEYPKEVYDNHGIITINAF